MEAVRVLCWNLFHGRDAPPDPRLFTLRSRVLRRPERNATHVQVNRPLFDEFAGVLCEAEWSLCLLQEAPPAWAELLGERCSADVQRALTSRNAFAALRRTLAGWNPDLIASNEGGSNMTLARSPWAPIRERHSLLLNPQPRRGLRERRQMAFGTVGQDGAEICVANLHASAGAPAQAEQDVLRAAEAAVEWSRGRPLIFGGDLNLRPRATSLFEELERRFGLRAPTAPDAIDHLLVRGLGIVEPPSRWPPERRELVSGRHGEAPLRLRLSDHAPVEAVFRVPVSSVR